MASRSTTVKKMRAADTKPISPRAQLAGVVLAALLANPECVLGRDRLALRQGDFCRAWAMLAFEYTDALLEEENYVEPSTDITDGDAAGSKPDTTKN